jgi:hypothetical protein
MDRCGADPAKHHRAGPPAPHVSCETPDAGEQVLEGVGGLEEAAQATADVEVEEGEKVVFCGSGGEPPLSLSTDLGTPPTRCKFRIAGVSFSDCRLWI